MFTRWDAKSRPTYIVCLIGVACAKSAVFCFSPIKSSVLAFVTEKMLVCGSFAHKIFSPTALSLAYRGNASSTVDSRLPPSEAFFAGAERGFGQTARRLRPIGSMEKRCSLPFAHGLPSRYGSCLFNCPENRTKQGRAKPGVTLSLPALYFCSLRGAYCAVACFGIVNKRSGLGCPHQRMGVPPQISVGRKLNGS
jgi:hypothetical protein